MKVRVHGKNLPKKFRLGAYAMTELTLRDLLGKSKVIKNLEIDIHFRHHVDNGEAMIHENEFRSRPRMFRVVIDPYKTCLLYTSPSPRDVEESRMPSSA